MKEALRKVINRTKEKFSNNRPVFILHKLRFIFVYFILLGFSNTIVAQDENQIVPPSPEATSIGKFVDNPVSAYTGTPKIEIPLYQLKSHQLSLPISLSYHASGIKMEELASFVGAGWTLNAGGIVSRTIRGLADELAYRGYLSQSPYSTYYDVGNFLDNNGVASLFQNVNTPNSGNCPNGANFHEDYANVMYASRGGLDLEPDLFFFSLPTGESGKFVFDRGGNIKLIPKQNANLQYFTNATGIYKWIITGKDGTKYFFEDVEITQSSSDCDEPSGPFAEQGQPSNLPEIDSPSSWKLTRIESVSGLDWIEFDYTGETLIYDFVSSETFQDVVSGSIGSPGFSSCTRFSTVMAKRLSKITSKAGYEVDFTAATSRQDIQGGYKLDNVIIRHKTSEIKRFIFTHSYAGGGSNYDEKLLMLDNVQEFRGTTSIAPAYEFTYYTQSITGFKRSSYNVDHWGYSNGQTGNSFKAPTMVYNGRVYSGANREPDLTYTRQWTLQKILYPTGGTTEFEYELNDFSNVPEFTDFRYSPGLQELASIQFNITNNINDNYTDTKYFTLSDTEEVVYLYEIPEVPGGIPVSGCGGTLTGPGSPAYNFSFQISGPSNPEIQNLSAGNYTLTAEFDPSLFNWGSQNLSELTFYIKVYRVKSLEELATSGNLKGGGLRVSKITSTGDNTIVKTYQYKYPGTSTSSGKLASFPSYAYLMAMNDGQPTPDGYSCTISNNGILLTRSTTSNYPLTLNQGAYVGYDEVIEYLGTPQQNNGYTLYRYTNQPDEERYAYFPIVPTKSYSYKNGLLLEQKEYTSSGSMVKRVVNTYDYSSSETIGLGVKVAQALKTGCMYCPNRVFTYTTYDQPTERIELRETQTWMAGTIEDLLTETSTKYTYDAYDQVIKTEQTTSDTNRKLFTEFTYNSSDRTAVEKTWSYYQQTPSDPFEYIDGKWTVYHGTHIIPKDIYQLEIEQLSTTQNPPPSGWYVKKKVIEAFDTQGNILQFRNEGDPSVTSVIWGYGDNKNLYPIAQVVDTEANHVAYTSFENNSEGGWTYGTNYNTTTFLTGAKGYNLTGGAIVTNDKNLVSGKTYVLSYWTNNTNPTIGFQVGGGTITNLISPVSHSNGTLYVKKIVVSQANTELQISGSGVIDELRLYPLGAQMTTYTYDVTRGVTSITDPNSYTSYYVYDDKNRLMYIKDFAGNILKRFEYHYEREN